MNFEKGDLVEMANNNAYRNIPVGCIGIVRKRLRDDMIGVEWLIEKVDGHNLDGELEEDSRQGYYVYPDRLKKCDKIIQWRKILCGNLKQ